MTLSTLRLLALCSLVSLSSATPALAQPGVSLFGSAGARTFWDEESFIGTGVAAGGGIALDATDRLRIRGRVVRSRNERDFGTGVVFERTATRYTGELIWRLSTGPHAGYVGAGLGGFAFQHESRLPGGQTFTDSGTELVAGGLTGFTALSRGRFSLQPEVSLWATRGYQIGLETGVLAVWRW